MLGRQGFIGNTTGGSNTVSVPWKGVWKEAWFVDNNDSIRRPNTPDLLPYHYSSVNRNGIVQNRNTPLGAITSEGWEFPQWDIQAREFQSGTPLGSSFSLEGKYHRSSFHGNSVSMTYTVGLVGLTPFRHYVNTEQFTITATEMVGYVDTEGMTFQFGLHRGTIRNVTTGITVTPTVPSILPTDVAVVRGTLPAVFGVLPVKLGDVIEIVAGTVINNTTSIRPSLLPEFGLPISNGGFYSNNLGFPYKQGASVRRGSRYITDAGSPQSLQGVRWVDAIYPDVPAYKIDFDVLFNNQNTRVAMTYQGGAGITSSLALVNKPTGSWLSGHELGFRNNQAPLAIGVWHSASVSLYPSNPNNLLTPTGWVIELSLGGVVMNQSITYDPAAIIASTPSIILGNLWVNSTKPILMRNIRMSYWERL